MPALRYGAAALLFDVCAAHAPTASAALRGRSEWCLRTLALAAERRCNVLGAQLTALASVDLSDADTKALCQRLVDACGGRGTKSNERYAALRTMALVACRNSGRRELIAPALVDAVQAAGEAGGKQLSSRLASSSDVRAEYASLLGLCARSQCIDIKSDAGASLLKHLYAALKDTEARVVERSAQALAEVALGLGNDNEESSQLVISFFVFFPFSFLSFWMFVVSDCLLFLMFH